MKTKKDKDGTEIDTDRQTDGGWRAVKKLKKKIPMRRTAHIQIFDISFNPNGRIGVKE